MMPFKTIPMDHALMVISSSPVPSHLFDWEDVVTARISLQVKGECKGEATHNQGLIEEFMAASLHPLDKEKGMEVMEKRIEDEEMEEVFVSILSFAWDGGDYSSLIQEVESGFHYCLAD